jgi:hypothetical protein
MNRQEIADLIYYSAAAHARSRGYRLGDGATDFFRANSEKAADLLNGKSQIDPELQLAIRNSHKLVSAMISARRAAYASNPERLRSKVIGEATLGAALARLCPIFPFCD